MDIVDYKERAKLARDRRENINIPNSTLEHAVYLTDLLFEKAEKSVKILTGTLSERFFNHQGMIESFKKLVKKNISIKVIVWHKIKMDEILDTLKSDFGGKVEIKTVDSERIQENWVKHFAVVDKKGYRIEDLHNPEDENDEDSIVKGNVNFYNPPVAKKLEETFDAIWQKIPS